MTFNEIKEAAATLIHAFGRWSWDNNSKLLKVKYNRDTYDYSFTMIEDGKTRKEVEHTDLERVTRCLITWVMGEQLANYN